MVEAAKDTDQSMEDILQSIKRIIADEGDAPAAPPPAAGSDVLELTEMLAEDAAVPAAPPPPPAAEPEPETPPMTIDEIMAAPVSSAKASPPPPPTPAPAPVAAVVEPPPPPPAPKLAPAPMPAADAGEKLMSDATLTASLDALHTLANRTPPQTSHVSPSFRSGETVEDLVLEALKPMLREWLDGNLPAMVRALVEREIRRLSS